MNYDGRNKAPTVIEIKGEMERMVEPLLHWE